MRPDSLKNNPGGIKASSRTEREKLIRDLGWVGTGAQGSQGDNGLIPRLSIEVTQVLGYCVFASLLPGCKTGRYKCGSLTDWKWEKPSCGERVYLVTVGVVEKEESGWCRELLQLDDSLASCHQLLGREEEEIGNWYIQDRDDRGRGDI